MNDGYMMLARSYADTSTHPYSTHGSDSAKSDKIGPSLAH